MSDVPQNIAREDILRAIERIDKEGVPKNAHSSTYNVFHGAKTYPPKLVISWANIYANGEELDRSKFSAGLGKPCFKILEENGFLIEEKDYFSEAYKLWNEFLQEWPEERVESMLLDEYTGSKDKNTFTYWVETRLTTLGSIKGVPSFKFGIFKRGSQSSKSEQSRYTYSDEYAWETKFGDSADKAFSVVKRHILEVITYVKSGSLEQIDEIPLSPVYKWKIAFLYQDQVKPQVLAIFKPENLIAFLNSANYSAKTPNSRLYLDILSQIGDDNILEFSRKVWNASEAMLSSDHSVVFDYYPQVMKFLEQCKTDNLKHRDYLKFAYGLSVKVGFGQTNPAKIPWISFLADGQSTSNGIYPVYLYFKEINLLTLGFGISETHKPTDSWPESEDPTYEEFLKTHHNYKPHRYGSSRIFKAYDMGQPLNQEVINNDLFELVKKYKELLSSLSEGAHSGDIEMLKMTPHSSQKLNTILYGPPGTGKTFSTINKSIEILDPVFLKENLRDRTALKNKFDQFVNEDRIGFVTFHQSFAYEDFVEGLKATTEDGQITYEVVDGVFKRMCEESSSNIEKESFAAIDVSTKTIWKMSLGNTLGSDSYIYDKCIESDEIRLGYGDDINFSGCSSRRAVSEKFIEQGYELKPQDYQVTSVDIFKNQVRKGDLVIVSDGNLKFRAIAEVTGDYECIPDPDFPDYGQTRKVIWHRVYDKSLPYERIMNKKFSQMTLYKLSSKTIDVRKLQSLLERNETSISTPGRGNRVLIIDEINRGNISSIFGELITLIEPSKRAGADEALSVTLPYSKDTFQVPSNLYLIGTMNTADRSLALMDTALRRRFDFIEMMPDLDELQGITVKGIKIASMLEKINKRIEVLYDREHTIGHAFFMPLLEGLSQDDRFALLQSIFRNKILPLLEEYFFEDWAKIRLVLGDENKTEPAHHFISKENVGTDLDSLFGPNVEYDLSVDEPVTYKRNYDALEYVESYMGIYDY